MSEDLPLTGPPPLRPGRQRQSMLDEEAASPPVTACRRCRKQKLRCSRDLPVCKRCRDISAVCEYPPPPDRKALAAQRLQNAKARARRESEGSGGSHQSHHKPSIDSGGSPFQNALLSTAADRRSSDARGRPESDATQYRNQTGSDELTLSPTPLQASLRRTTLPSAEVAAFLFEIYFSRLYNAPLLFHKHTFLSEYAANQVPDFVALSIFALASIFLRQSPGANRQGNDEDGVELGVSMLSAADSLQQGHEWATAASQRVLMQADIPRLETIQACQNLALYWFSRGQTQRTNIHTHTAYMTARLLNLHIQPTDGDDGTDARELSDELGRRCFWSCWITNCISQENAHFKAGNPWKDALGLPLPSDEDSYNMEKPVSQEYFDDGGSIKVIESSPFKPQPSIMGEMVKLYCLWWEIQNFIKQHDATKAGDSIGRIAELLELDRRLGTVFENLHPHLRYQNTASFLSKKQDPYRLLLLHSLYRLCACALHSSIVPLFSNTPSNPHIAKKLVRLSAQETVKHASLILDMATAFSSTRPDISKLPSLTGYAMFVATTVHFKSLVVQHKLEAHATSRFKSAVSILGRLREYWNVHQGSWDALKTLFSSKGIEIDLIATSASQPLVSDEQPTDLERIVSHEAAQEESGRTDIYTYVAEETKGASPRHPSSDSTSQRRASAQNTPSPGSLSVPRTTEQRNAVHGVTNDSELRKFHPDARTFTLPHQQHPNPQSQPPFTQGLQVQQVLAASSQHMRQVHAGMPGGFMPLGTLAEEHQGSTATMSHVPLEARLGVGQNMDGFGDVSGLLGTDMEIDGATFWWDQSYGSFEANLNQINQESDGGPFQFEGFSFG